MVSIASFAFAVLAAAFALAMHLRLKWFLASVPFRREAMEQAGQVAKNDQAPMRARKFALYLVAIAGSAKLSAKVIRTAEKIDVKDNNGAADSVLAGLEDRWSKPLHASLRNVAIATCLQDPESAPAVYLHVTRKHVKAASRVQERREEAIIESLLDRGMRERPQDLICA
jgi:hypothetical protein